jgi:hypothetical protein
MPYLRQSKRTGLIICWCQLETSCESLPKRIVKEKEKFTGTVFKCGVCTFDAVAQHEKHSHAIGSRTYSYIHANFVTPVRDYNHPVHMRSYAACDTHPCRPCDSTRKPQVVCKPMSSSGYVVYTPRRPPSSHARGAARHFPPLDFLHRFLSLNHAYAAFGSCGLVVPVTSPFVAPSATSTAAGNCP